METIKWVIASLIGCLLILAPIYFFNSRDYAASATEPVGELEVTQDQPVVRRSNIEVPITVHNVTKGTVDSATIQCDALRDDGGLQESTSVSFNTIRANQSVHDLAVFMNVGKAGLKVACKLV